MPQAKPYVDWTVVRFLQVNLSMRSRVFDTACAVCDQDSWPRLFISHAEIQNLHSPLPHHPPLLRIVLSLILFKKSSKVSTLKEFHQKLYITLNNSIPWNFCVTSTHPSKLSHGVEGGGGTEQRLTGVCTHNSVDLSLAASSFYSFRANKNKRVYATAVATI